MLVKNLSVFKAEQKWNFIQNSTNDLQNYVKLLSWFKQNLPTMSLYRYPKRTPRNTLKVTVETSSSLHNKSDIDIPVLPNTIIPSVISYLA